MALVLWALIEGDGDGLAEQLLRLGTRRPGADSEAFRTAVIEGLDQFGSDDGNHSVTGLLMDQLAAGGVHGISFPRGLMLLARAREPREITRLDQTGEKRCISPGGASDRVPTILLGCRDPVIS